jgi:EAL and modified HD-GYP domain-containing signal transduction protein
VLPAGQVVLELTEDIEPDDDVLRACRNLRQAGYMLALDDFVLTDRTESLIPHAKFHQGGFSRVGFPMRVPRLPAKCPPGCHVICRKDRDQSIAFETARREGTPSFRASSSASPSSSKAAACRASIFSRCSC